jgi:hypothetical protein
LMTSNGRHFDFNSWSIHHVAFPPFQQSAASCYTESKMLMLTVRWDDSLT